MNSDDGYDALRDRRGSKLGMAERATPMPLPKTLAPYPKDAATQPRWTEEDGPLNFAGLMQQTGIRQQ